mgnify:CR=1 FL=1
MKLYHKVFKSHADMSVYLANMDPLISYDEELLNRLTNARNTDELYDAKCSILRDFRDIYAFDASEAEFPEPIGHFDDEEEKIKFIRKKILLQDIAFYLGSVYKKYHSIIYQTHNRLPEIELKRLAIDYNEIYRKAMEDYIATLVTGGQHAVTASFVLPSLIEQGLGMALQNRMLFKCIMQLNDLTEEEKKIIKPFLHNDKVLFYGTEKFAMEKLYRLFVEKGVLKNTPDNEMILTGVCLKGKRKLTRTLGGLLNSNFAKEEIRPEYLELLKREIDIMSMSSPEKIEKTADGYSLYIRKNRLTDGHWQPLANSTVELPGFALIVTAIGSRADPKVNDERIIYAGDCKHGGSPIVEALASGRDAARLMESRLVMAAE